MRATVLLVAIAATCLTIFFSPTQSQEPFRIKVPNPGLDKDGPEGYDGPYPVSPQEASSMAPILGSFTFDLGGLCTDEGWTSHDITVQTGLYWHVDDFVPLGGGTNGLLVPLSGNQSLWCGVRPGGSVPNCSYVNAPGYGNDWDQWWRTKTCVSLANFANVSMEFVCDFADIADYVAIGYAYCSAPETFVEVARYTGQQGPTTITESLPSQTTTGEPIYVVIRVVTGMAGSDYDGVSGLNAVDTDGAAILDSLWLFDANGDVIPIEDFESASVMATSTADWEAYTPPGYGDFAGLFPGLDYVQKDPFYTNLTCAWGFWDGSLVNFACGGFPAQATIPYENVRGQYIQNEIWSPWMSYGCVGSQTVHLDFDVYHDNPLDALVFYYWKVRETDGICEKAWRRNSFVYYSATGAGTWKTGATKFSANLTPFLDNPTEIQVALGVVDMCEYWCGILGTGSCHSHAPTFDNVVVECRNTQSWVVEDGDLFQDAFPSSGLTTGTVECNAPSGDFMVAMVHEMEYGIDYHINGNPASGPAVYLYVRNLPGKAGMVVESGNPDWPYLSGMSTADWTVIQMAATGAPNVYTVDINDALYEPGDVVEFFFSARDAGGNTAYWSQFTGTTTAMSDVVNNPMEMTALPAGADFLYVDHYSGYGAEPYYDTAFQLIGIEVDRFDRRAPTSLYDNTLGDQVFDAAQLEPYSAILVNTGSLSGDLFHAADYQDLYSYLDNANTVAGLHISGDDAAEFIATDPSAAAGNLRFQYLDYTLVATDHHSAGLSLSPFVIASANGCFDHILGPDTLVAFGGAPAANTFDVLSSAGTAVTEMYYDGAPSDAAVVSQITANGNGGTAYAMIAGFSFHNIRSDRPQYYVPERMHHMHDILWWMQNAVPLPTPAGDTPPVNELAQNYPNPFNPTTTIRFSIRERGTVSLAVYDVSGALVRTLQSGEVAAGEQTVTWDGSNDAGQRVSSGVYFYRLVAPGFVETRKMVMLK